MESLLTNLRKYRPREGHDPIENFITESFAWLLKSSEQARQSILELVNQRLKEPLLLDLTDIQISTQENFGGVFPDLLISAQGKMLVFEHKVHSELHRNQLQNYRNYAAKHSDDYRVILITAAKGQHQQTPDAALCWRDVHKAILDIQGSLNNDGELWAVKEFLNLLESEQLGPIAPINRFSIAHYFEAKKFEQELDVFFRLLEDKDWPLKRLGLNPTAKKRMSPEGRIGLEFCPEIEGKGRQWAPAIFCGVMLNGKDHQIDDVCNEQIQLAVVLDLNTTAQQQVIKSEAYKSFTIDFQTMVEKLNCNNSENVWQYTPSNNRWHPHILLTPMVDAFQTEYDHEKQLNRLFELFSQVQNELANTESFEQLIRELSVLR